MTDSPLISRSQLLLQYLLAGNIDVANQDRFEASLDVPEFDVPEFDVPEFDVPEVGDAAGDSECSA